MKSPCFLGSWEKDFRQRLFRKMAVLVRKIRWQVHRIVQDAGDFHDVRFGNAIDKEVPWLSNPIAGPARRLAAEREMIDAAILCDFRPLSAAGAIGILRDFVDRRRNEICVAVQGLRTKTLFRPGQNVGNVPSRLRSEDDFHGLTGRSGQLWTGPRFRSLR